MIKKQRYKKFVILILLLFGIYFGYTAFVRIIGECFKRKIEYIYTEDINLTKLDLSNYKFEYQPVLTIDFVSKGGSSTGKIKFEGSNELKEINYAFPNKYMIDADDNEKYSLLIIVYDNKKYYLKK